MSENVFLSSLPKITGGALGLPELINAATELVGAGQPALAEQLYRIWIGFNPEHPQLFIALFNCSGLQSQSGDMAGAACVGIAVRSLAGKAWIERQAVRIDGLNVIVLLLFAVGLMGDVLTNTINDPLYVLGLLGLSAAARYVVTGIVLIIAVSIDALASRGRASSGLG